MGSHKLLQLEQYHLMAHLFQNTTETVISSSFNAERPCLKRGWVLLPAMAC